MASRVAGVLVAGFALVAALPSSANAHEGGSFPCRWNWDLEVGQRAGYVTAVGSARCGGRAGKLTIGVRLFRWLPKGHRWHLDRAATQTWTDLGPNRFTGASERCAAATYRAEFRWTLRDPGGSVAGRNFIRTGTLEAPGPDCIQGIR